MPQLITPPPSKSVVLAGDDVTIPCQAIGTPEPVITWYAVGDPIPLQSGPKYDIYANGSLLIRNVLKGDAKAYRCTAENLKGPIAKEARVELACKLQPCLFFMYQMKGWMHNRLMSNFRPFFYFSQICQKFCM